MTIHVVQSAPAETAERKRRTGRCVVLFCRRKPRTGGGMCNTCRDRLWRARHPEHHIWKNLRVSARRRGITFSLTLTEFKAFCQESDFAARCGKEPSALTVDRIDPAQGYSAGNIRPLSHQENSLLGMELSRAQRTETYTPEENPLL